MVKKKIFVLSLLATMLSVGLWSCTSDDDDEVNGLPIEEQSQNNGGNADDGTDVDGDSRVIAPLAVSEEVQAFFDSELTLRQHTSPHHTFFYWKWGGELIYGEPADNVEKVIDTAAQFCLQVNSREELQDLYHGDLPLPDIDFSVSTLLIGMYACSMTEITAQRLEKTEEGYHLTIDGIDDERGVRFDLVVSINYWGLYPKLEQKPIEVTVNEEVIR